MDGGNDNDRFNAELRLLIDGKLPKNHVFHLGLPGAILQRCGFPPHGIELAASRLLEKAGKQDHPFAPKDIMNMVQYINEPVAVFSYGNRVKAQAKAQNVIVELQKDGKNFLAGVHFNQERGGTTINSIRGLFPKDNHEWLNWINQGKLLYADIEKLQKVVSQQRINAADVTYLNLEPINSLLQQNKNVKHFFTENVRGNTMADAEFEDSRENLENVELLIPNETRRDAFFREFFGVLDKYGVGEDGIEDALYDLDVSAEKALIGRLELDLPYQTDVANLFVKYSGLDLQIQDGFLVNPAPFGAEQINAKEKSMSDEYEETQGYSSQSFYTNVGEEPPEVLEQQKVSPKTPAEQAFLNAMHQRKQISESLANGSHPCLPGSDGYADTSPALNVMSGKVYHGENLLYLKDFQKRNGFPTGEFATYEAIKKSGIPIRDSEFKKSATISMQEKTGRKDEQGKDIWETKNYRLYNLAQTAAPWKVRKYAEDAAAQREKEREAYNKSQFGEQNYQKPEKAERKPGPELVCTSSEPDRYLAQYFAAVSMGSKFKVSEDLGKQFPEKMDALLHTKDERFHTKGGKTLSNPFALQNVCREASRQCKDVITEAKKLEAPQHTQTHSRGM